MIRKTKIVAMIIAMCKIVVVMAGCTVVAEDKYANTCVLYKIGNNSIVTEVSWDDIGNYINDSYEWSIEPTVLMYTADGRTSWIWESEVNQYERVGWSTQPPVMIYSATSERVVLTEEVGDYIATGIWFRTIEEARPIAITMDAFTKTNLTPQQLESVLTKGLSGYGQAFYDMEQKYGVNAIYAISVAEFESGYGTSYDFRIKNNAFGVGPGIRFGSVQSGIEYFGELMNSSLYYGKNIDAIGVIYCDKTWASMVKKLMHENYAGLIY